MLSSSEFKKGKAAILFYIISSSDRVCYISLYNIKFKKQIKGKLQYFVYVI